MLTSDIESTSVKDPKPKLLPYICRICGAPADYLYFGVISCRSCKMFFKRNGNNSRQSVCHYGGQCEINITNRNTCTSCRLEKCFKMGMSTDKFRSPIPKKRKSNSPTKTTNILSRSETQQCPTLNLLRSDQSLFSNDQWTLVSNLLNDFNESKLLLLGQRLIDTYDIKQSTNLIYQSLIQEFIASIYETTGRYLLTNTDYCHLPPSIDRSIILHNAANNVSCICCAFVTHYCHLCDLEGFSNIMENIYGKNLTDMFRWIIKFADSDIVLIKLAISLLSISESTYKFVPNDSLNLSNSIMLLNIQNQYAEITWKYLLYKYGYYQAVKRFLNMIAWFLGIKTFLFYAETVVIHGRNIKKLVEQTELTLILNEVDEILEEK